MAVEQIWLVCQRKLVAIETQGSLTKRSGLLQHDSYDVDHDGGVRCDAAVFALAQEDASIINWSGWAFVVLISIRPELTKEATPNQAQTTPHSSDSEAVETHSQAKTPS